MTKRIKFGVNAQAPKGVMRREKTDLNTIAVASFMGSGSSAAIDLLREYENVNCPNGSYEYVYLYCPNGLFDLEDKLLLNNNALRSDEALRTFETAMQELFGNEHWWFASYKTKVTPNFMELVNEFVDSISYQIKGYWYDHQKVSANRQRWAYILKKLGRPAASVSRKYHDEMRLSYPSDDDFFEAASKFVEKTLLGIARDDNEKTLLVDQLLLPHNFYRKDNYFSRDRLKVILVIRDPRDVFILNKYYWRPAGEPIPYSDDVSLFCKQYRSVRSSVLPYDACNVLEINFEDLVLDHQNSLTAIEGFCGPWLGEHTKQGKYFKPEESARNICVYRDKKEYEEEAAIIESQLSEYLYTPSSYSFYSASRINKIF